MNTPTPMTVNGAKNLNDELQHLKNTKRVKIIQDIAEARAHGDLKENAEYHAAKEQQSFIEGRIKEIEVKLSNSQIIDITKLKQSCRCIFGSTIKLINLNDNTKITYQIVGEDEADINKSKISCYSPIAQAMLGKEEGEEVIVKAPKGDIYYEILSVAYIT